MAGTVTPRLVRSTSHGVTLLGDPECPSGVTLAFTERGGGVSDGPYASLNLGDQCGDDAACVSENRRRALAAMGLGGSLDSLVVPRQVHGNNVVTIADDAPKKLELAREQAQAGADAVVCAVHDAAVLLCFADCVPLILVCAGGFAVAHCGWRGCMARVAEVSVRALCAAAHADASDVRAYVGPHISGEDYVVSSELRERFEESFGREVILPGSRVDLGACVRKTLVDTGVSEGMIVTANESTATTQDRFFSYRASGGTCGRHGAIACMPTAHGRAEGR